MAAEVGTLAWAREHRGVLAKEAQAAFVRSAVPVFFASRIDEALHKLGLRRARPSHIEAQDLLPPDSRAATEAARICRESSPPYLYNHCERSYAFARILGALSAVEADPELLYVAAMAHDLGLTETFGGLEGRPTCFSIVSANEAARLLGDLGWEAQRIETVCEAIVLHLNARVQLRHGPEAHLLNQATALDTVGMRKWRIENTELKAVFREHPRFDQNESLSACWKCEARRFPGSRAALLEDNGMVRKGLAPPFSLLLRNARFD